VVGLNAARVLIVDDKESEVLDLVRALWKVGVAPLYVDPTTINEGDASWPLSGIRLAFLDMDIVGAGADSTSKVAALANCLRSLIHKDNGPYVAIAWTNHPELVNDFDAYIFSIHEIPRPSALIMIAKEDCSDIGSISARIDKELAGRASSVRMLEEWESASVLAAGEVIGELSAIASGVETGPERWRKSWDRTILRVMHTCAKESVGEDGIADGASAYKAFCHSLVPLHEDKLERGVSLPPPDLLQLTKSLLDVTAKEDCGIEAKARINRMMHCSFDELKTLQAGSVYLLEKSSLRPLFPELTTMLKTLVPIRSLSPEEQAKRVAEIASQVKVVAVETSPTCDHIQGRLILARLLGGYLVPVRLREDSLKNNLPASIWELSPLWLSFGGSEFSSYALLVDCLLLSSCGLDKLKSIEAFFRIRNQAFSALQVHFASHAARPGMVLLK